MSSANANSKKQDGSLTVDKRNDFSARCTWTIPDVKGKIKQKAVWSKYFDVGGYDCRLLVYPGGDSQALPGHISVYLQITDPSSSTAKWDCFTSYRLCIENQVDADKSVSRDSWHRFSPKKKSHGWCDFTPGARILDGKSGFCINDAIVVSADILLLKEEYTFQREADVNGSSGSSGSGGGGSSSSSGADVLAGKFTWRVHNISMFMEVMSLQKIMSPVFPAGDCLLRLSVYQSIVGDADYLSMCLETKDSEKGSVSDKSCWCLFRMSVQSHKEKGGQHMQRDSYGRFATDARTGDTTSLGWNDFMHMRDFLDVEQNYVNGDGTAIFCVSFHIIREQTAFMRGPERHPLSSVKRVKMGAAGDAFQGKFTWKIEHFTKLKELLKKRKIASLCIKSKRFQVGGKDCRLIVYPRGQSQPPMHLSLFLEVTDPRNQDTDWSCFVSHRLSVVHQGKDADKDRSVSKESQNRYSKAAKDWGWREFVTLTSLFDTDLGFLVNDTVVLCAEVLILKESCDVRLVPLAHDSSRVPAMQHSPQSMDSSIVCPSIPPGKKLTFSWKIDNFLAFKQILETRKIFSKYLSVGGCELRIGVYESFDTLCIYLESEAPAHSSPQEGSFWVQYRIAAVSQKWPAVTEWKESSICTRAWSNSVLQFIKLPDMLDSDKGYLVKDSIVLACEILECTPWLEFGDADLTFSDSDVDAPLPSPDPCDHWPRETEGDATAAAEGHLLKTLSAVSGVLFVKQAVLGGLGDGGGTTIAVPSAAQAQAALHSKLVHDDHLLVTVCGSLRGFLQDATRVQRLAATRLVNAPGDGGAAALITTPPGCPSLLDLLLSITPLQAPLLDLLQALLLAVLKQTSGAREPSAAAAPAVIPPLVTAEEAASLAPPAEVFASTCAARWSAICAAPFAALPRDFAQAALDVPAPAVPVLPDDPKPDAAQPDAAAATTAADSPAVLFALAQPTYFLSSYLSLSPLMIAAGSPPLPPPGTAAPPATPAAAVRSLLLVLARAARAIDAWALQSARATQPPLGIPAPSADTLQQLLTLAPPDLRPHVAMLTPVLLPIAQHTMAAGVLLSSLSEGSAELQLAACAAVAMLHLEPADSVFADTLASLPSMPQRDLPGALALATKLAADSPEAAAQCATAARAAVSRLGEDVSLPTLQALCLVVLQHSDVAAALLADIAREAAAGGGDRGSATADAELLLEAMQVAHLRDDAVAVFETVIASGRLSADDMRLLLERRRMQHTMFCSLAARIAATKPPPWQPAYAPSATVAAAPPAVPATGNVAARMPPMHAAAVQSPLATAPDGFDTTLGLATALSASPAPAVQAFTLSLYLQMFSLWPSTPTRVRLIHALAHRLASNASPPSVATSPSARSAESRALLVIIEEWPKYGSSVLLCLLDLLAKQAIAHKALTAAQRDGAQKLEAAHADAAAAAAKASDERKLAAEATAAAQLAARERQDAADSEKAVLRSEVSDLQAQVQQHAAEVRTAQQETSAAVTRATAAERDARAARGRLGALEDEAKQLRGQAQQDEKRRTRDARALKDAEARVAERDGQLDTANKNLAKRTADLRKATTQIKTSQKEAQTKADALAEATKRITELEERLQTQTQELATLREEQSHQRVLLPPGMEAELDADVADDRKGSQSSRAGTTSAPGADAQNRAFSPWDYRGAFAPQAAAPGEGGATERGLRARGSMMGLDASAAFAEAGKQESSMSAPGGTDGGAGSAARAEDNNSRRGAVAAAAVSAAGVNPAAKPFIASTRQAGSANPSPTQTRSAMPSQASYHSSPVSLPHDSGVETGGHTPQRPLSQQQMRPPATAAALRQQQQTQPPPPPPQRSGQPAGPQGGAQHFARSQSGQSLPPQWAYNRMSRPSYLMSGNAPLSSLGFFESGPDSNSGAVSSTLGNSGGTAASGATSVEKLPGEFLSSGMEMLSNGAAMPGPLLQTAGLPRTASGFGGASGMGRGARGGKASEPADGALPFMLMGRNGQGSSQNIWGQPNGHPF